MNILIVGFYSPETMAWYLERNLKKMGHNVDIFCYRSIFKKVSPNSMLSKGFRHLPLFENVYLHKINNTLLNIVKKKRYNLVIFLKAETIFPSTIAGVRSYSDKIINWYMDPIIGLDKGFILESIQHYDYFFTKDSFIKKRLNELGFSNVEFLLEAFDPEVYTPTKKFEEYKSDISMVGNIYDYRLRILNSLKEYDLKVWGKLIFINKDKVRGFYQGRPAISDEKNKIFNSAKIVLNTHNPFEISGANVRLFEICGSGAFQLSDTTLYTDHLFKNKKEVVFYNNIDELKELAQYYLKNNEERNKIALEGHKRVIKEHTYGVRLNQLFKIIKMN